MGSAKREIWIDWMRLAACFMVIVTHCTEPFYLGGEGSLILTKADSFWVAGFCVFTRAAVALFVVASSYLQFPLHYSPGEFLRRRAVRVLVPFLIWSLVYALVWGDSLPMGGESRQKRASGLSRNLAFHDPDPFHSLPSRRRDASRLRAVRTSERGKIPPLG